MKKKSVLISGLLVLLGIVSLPIKTNAATMDSIYTCGDEIYYVDKIGASDESGIGYYTMNYYDTTNADGSSAGKTYCINPGMYAPTKYGLRTYRCSRVINPTETNKDDKDGEPPYYQSLDVALTKAYQLLHEQGLIGTSTRERYIGELVFRWLYTNYGGVYQPTLGNFGRNELNKFLHQTGGKVETRWYEGNDNVQTAIRIMEEAVSVGDLIYGGSMTYDQLVEQGYLWGDQWTFNAQIDSSASNPSNNQTYMTVNVKAAGSAPQVTYWNDWSVSCENGYTCSITNIQIVSNTEANFTVLINTSGGNTADYGMTFTSSYYDPRDGTANMMELAPTTKANQIQKMFVIAPGAQTIAPSNPGSSNPSNPSSGGNNGGGGGGHEHEVVSESSCYCDETTGIYHYTATETVIDNGNSTSSIVTETCDTNTQDCTSFVQEHGSCPGTCTKKKTCVVEDDKYYCTDGNECTEEEYKDQCTHHCEESSESSTGFFCKESSPGAGDGQPCSEQEYRYQCLGEVNCYPTIDLPSSCNDLSDNVEGIANGTVSDINEVASTCNPSVNQIKKCVLGGTDLTGESFEATNELSDNPYCKVYCKEKYDFVLPTAQITQSGGYFTLSTTVTGQRDCYTASADNPTEPIDSEKFQQDLVAAERAVIDAWNNYNHWKEGTKSEHMWTTTESDSDDGCVHSHQDCYESCEADGSNCREECDTVCDEWCDESGEWTIVHHEWDYVVYNYDGSTSTRHQSEITDGGGSCWTCGCTGSEGNGESQIPVFQQRADQARNELKDAITKLNNIISQYNSCSGAVSNTSNTNISGVSSAASTDDSSWVNDMIFEPQVDFWYDQDYMNQGFNGTFVEDSRESEISENTYCSGDVDDQYNCTSGKTSSVATTTQAILTCDDSGCSWKNFNISTAKWVQKTKINEGTYISGNEFSTYTQYGTIKLGYAGCNGRDCLLTDLPEGSLPISLITETGVFPFTFTFSHIGQSNSGNSTGRLIGSTNSVIVKYQDLPASMKCSGDVDASVDGGYVCHYLNNCTGDDCDFTCEDDDDCTFTVCDEGECIITCENCIFDGGKAVYSYRTVTLNDLFPNGSSGRSYNWNSAKGRATIEAIEADGDEIYQTPQYSYTLSPTNMRNIREYNDLAGSFTNSNIPEEYASRVGNSNAIYCEHYEFNGLNYNINCRSSFLDLIDESGRTFATDVTRVTQDDDAFELFDQNRCSTGAYGSGDCEYVGPSWRLKGSSNE